MTIEITKHKYNFDFSLRIKPKIPYYPSLNNELKNSSIETFRLLQNKLRVSRKETFSTTSNSLEHSNYIVFEDEVFNLKNLDVIDFCSLNILIKKN